MPQPAPARFDAKDRRNVRASLLGALGPTIALTTLIVGYALSARACHGSTRALIGVCIGFGGIAVIVSASSLFRARRSASEHAPNRSLWPAAIALQIFCLLVLGGYGIALAMVSGCD
jgi:hypothetical protein